MKTYLYIAVSILLLSACRDQSTPPPLSIEGRWSQLIPEHPPRTYDFRNGVVTQITYVGITPVATLQFVYAERSDTVLIGGDGTNPPRTWLIRFIGDGAAEVHQAATDPLGLGARFILERL